MSIESPTPEELKVMQEALLKAQSQAQPQQSGNPLSGYMRTPQIYISLPSGGKFWKEGSIDLPSNGEIPVLAMSTKDELILKSPDALLNGQAVVDVIEHCIPSIKDAWEIPVCDFDTILIGIRIASYGEQMGYTSQCPECQEVNEYEIDLRRFIDMKVDTSGYDQLTDYKDLKVKLKPATYRAINAGNMEQFEQQRMFAVVNAEDLSEEKKLEQFNQVFARLTELNVRQLAETVDYIEMPDGQKVDNRHYLNEFITGADRKVIDVVQKHQAVINQGNPNKDIPAKCPDCGNEYTTPFTFDQANFFESVS